MQAHGDGVKLEKTPADRRLRNLAILGNGVVWVVIVAVLVWLFW
jgi:hypothetical protein